MVKLQLKSSLERFLRAQKIAREPQEIEVETEKKFLQLIEKQAEIARQKDPSFATIPRFFDARTMAKEKNLQSVLFKESRTRFLREKALEIMDKEEMETVWLQLKGSSSLPEDGNERINYDAFLRVGAGVSVKAQQFFSASTFLKFDRDEYGRIDSLSFFQAVVRKTSLLQTRVQMALYDSGGLGFLSEKDLEHFLLELLPSFPNLAGMSEALRPKYLVIALQKFFFFLDPKKTGRLAIKDVLVSSIFAELYDLRGQKSPEELLNNWFSLQNVGRIAELFDRLDEDADGLLGLGELSKFRYGLTELFLRRALEELSSAQRQFKLDFKDFVRFVLIVENRKTPQSLLFLFKCVDLFASQRIDWLVISAFFKEVVQLLLARDPDADKNFRVEDVRDEIFDMASPKHPLFITLYDLYACGQGDLILGIMVDAKAFFEYDQRESVTPGEEDTSAEGAFAPGKMLEEQGSEPAPAVAKYGKSAEV